MKRFKLIAGIVCMVLMVAVPVFAGNLHSVANTAGYATAPPLRGQPVIVALNTVGGAATADLIIYEGDETMALSVLGKAATATTFVLDSCTGIDDDDIVVIAQRNLYDTIEAAVVSACNDTTETVTLAAGTANAFNGTLGFEFYEMKVLTTWADVGTTRLDLEGDLLAGTEDKPLTMTYDGTGGTFHFVTVEW